MLEDSSRVMLIWTLCFGILVLLGCSFAERLGRGLGVIDHPDGRRKKHARPTPLVGGIVLMTPLSLLAAHQAATEPLYGPVFLALAIAGFGLMSLGWFDDRHQAPPGIRLLVSALLLGTIALSMPEFRLTTLSVGSLAVPLGLFAVPFTVLCLVGLLNAINMADGLNGLVIGLSIFWTTCLLFYAPPALMPFLSLLLLGLFVLLPYNLAGRLFLGDAGSYALGVTLGLLMIYVHHQAHGRLPMLTVALWLFVPVLDCLRVMTTRLLAGRSPMLPDTNHLHHRLARCWRWPYSVLAYVGAAAVPGLIAAIWPAQTGVMLLLELAAYGAILWLTRSRESGVRGFRRDAAAL